MGWVISMAWNDLLFAHWPLDKAVLRPLVPPRIEIETFGGSAWLGMTPFRMTEVHLRCIPPVPSVSAFEELNVRTYVTDGRIPGVYFFSLDAHSRLAVAVARGWYHLSYHYARMDCRKVHGVVQYSSARIGEEANFTGQYRAVGPVFRSSPGTLEHWLTSRYCLFAGGSKDLWRVEVYHAPWPPQAAEADIRVNTMTQPLGMEPSLTKTKPHLLFAERLEVVASSPRHLICHPLRVRSTSSPVRDPAR